jgi:hypothetical protein
VRSRREHTRNGATTASAADRIVELPAMRRAALTLLCSTLASCGNPAPRDGAPTPSKLQPASPPDANPVASSLDAAGEQTSTTSTAETSGPSLTEASTLTPKLEEVVRVLRGKKGTFKIKDELARSIPGFATDDGEDLPDEVRVDILEVRRAFLAMAFLRITDKEPAQPDGPCDSSRPANTRVLYVGSDDAGHARLRLAGELWSKHAGFEVEFFDGKRPTVVVPPIAATVPVLEVRYDYEPRCYTSDGGKKAEIFHVGNGTRIGDPISLDTHVSVTGRSRDERAEISWLAAKTPGTALLAITQVTTETTWPCTGDPAAARSPECRTQYACARSTRVFVVTADSALEERQVESLRRTEPGLAKLPADRSEDSESACRRLTPK